MFWSLARVLHFYSIDVFKCTQMNVVEYMKWILMYKLPDVVEILLLVSAAVFMAVG